MLTIIFCHIDDFCNFFFKEAQKKLLPGSSESIIKSKMTLSEVMTIYIYWHHSGYSNFKNYYSKHVLINLKKEFPNAVSYSRFIELVPYAMMPLFVLSKSITSNSTGESFIDSTKL